MTTRWDANVTFRSTKTYPHSMGLSCAFRQWRAGSHCRFLHGYALAVRVEFEAIHLDDRNWVIDFGALGMFKATLASLFDHKTIVAIDDPQMAWFEEGDRIGTLELVVVEATGCERFAELIGRTAMKFLHEVQLDERVRVARVEVSEHEGNSAIWEVSR